MRGGDETYYGWTAVELAIEATRHVAVVALLRTLGARCRCAGCPVPSAGGIRCPRIAVGDGAGADSLKMVAECLLESANHLTARTAGG